MQLKIHPQKSPHKFQHRHHSLTQVIEYPMKRILKNKEIQHQGLHSKLSTSVELLTEKPSIQLNWEILRSHCIESERDTLIKKYKVAITTTVEFKEVDRISSRLTNDTSQRTNKVAMTGTMTATSKELDRRNWIIWNNDDDVDVTKEVEEPEPENLWTDRRTHWPRRNKWISQSWEEVPRDE